MNSEWLINTKYAHRGLHGADTGIVENSPSAFQEAIIKNMGFELDVLLSKDGKAIVFHDEKLDRLTAHKGSIINYTGNELEKIHFLESSDTIPSLKKVLTDTKGKASILIEIKGDQGLYTKIAEAVWTDIKDYDGPIAIMSFYPEIVEHFKKRHPNVIRGLVATSLDDGDLPEEYFMEDHQIKTIKNLDVNFIAYDIRVLPNSVTEYCRSNKIPVLTWTVRSEDDKDFALNHADSIIFEL